MGTAGYYYMRGTCELENGNIKFQGGFQAVSLAQAWYFCIYAIRDAYPSIDYWIAPNLSNADRNRNVKNFNKFRCEFIEFKDKGLRKKLKLSKEELNKLEKLKYLYNQTKPIIEFGHLDEQEKIDMSTIKWIYANEYNDIGPDYIEDNILKNEQILCDTISSYYHSKITIEDEKKIIELNNKLNKEIEACITFVLNYNESFIEIYLKFNNMVNLTQLSLIYVKNSKIILNKQEIIDLLEARNRIYNMILSYYETQINVLPSCYTYKEDIFISENQFELEKIEMYVIAKRFIEDDENEKILAKKSMDTLFKRYNNSDIVKYLQKSKFNIKDRNVEILTLNNVIGWNELQVLILYDFSIKLSNLLEEAILKNEEIIKNKEISMSKRVIYLFIRNRNIIEKSKVDKLINELKDRNRKHQPIENYNSIQNKSIDDSECEEDLIDYGKEYDMAWLEDMCNLPEGVGLFDDDR